MQPETSNLGNGKTRRRYAWLAPAVFSGILLGMAFPPFGVDWSIWFALIPLLWVIQREERTLYLFLAGFVAGLIFFLSANHPLTSGEGWTGWMVDVAPGEREELIGRQYFVLKFLWIVLSAWCAFFWGLFSVGLGRLANGSLFRMAVFAPPLVVLVAEWLRSVTTWDYQWAFLGNAAIDFEPVLQLGALGGVWLLSWLVVLTNVGLLAAILLPLRIRAWPLPVGILSLLILVVLGGMWRAQTIESSLSERDDDLDVAAIQFIQSKTARENYTRLGLERAYLELMALVARGDAGPVDLIVLPESVAVGALALDGSRIPEVPEQIQWPVEDWQRAISWVMAQSDAGVDIIMGLDTVSEGKLHNSLVFWNDGIIEGVYHKRRLVPFSEYQPKVLGLFGIRGRMQYKRGGSSRIGDLDGIRIGGFICQEVQIPSVIRQSVRGGAELLVSGGNDGVFGNPAVAEVHANLARLRAVESGRFIVRAMKTGISAIISPTGRERSRSATTDSSVVVGRIQPLRSSTLYVRFGDWPLALAFGLLLIGIPISARQTHS